MNDFAHAGSQRWLQVAVERMPHLLSVSIGPAPHSAGKSGNSESHALSQINWFSPVRSDAFKEYRDMAALRKLGVEKLARPLGGFWPPRGPVWDALGKTADGQLVFVEAKANIPEAASPRTFAKLDSRKLIKRSLKEAQRFYGAARTSDWSGTFYQYANRLTHLYFYRHVNGLPAHLVFFYFINATDVHGPAKVEEWKAAIHLLHAALGLPRDFAADGVHEVFVDAAPLMSIEPPPARPKLVLA